MKTLRLDSTELEMDFNHSMQLAQTIADHLLGASVLLSWYDRKRDMEAPAHVSECHAHCDRPGYLDYAANRGAALVVDFGGGTFVFCFRPLGEFA